MKKIMKKLSKILVAILLAFSFLSVSFADSGFDSDYSWDSGGSWGSSYSSSYDYDSSWSSSSGSSSSIDDGNYSFIVLVALFIIILMNVLKNSIPNNRTKPSTSKVNFDTNREDVPNSVITYNLKGLQINEVKEAIKNIYIKYFFGVKYIDFNELRDVCTQDFYKKTTSDLAQKYFNTNYGLNIYNQKESFDFNKSSIDLENTKVNILKIENDDLFITIEAYISLYNKDKGFKSHYSNIKLKVPVNFKDFKKECKIDFTREGTYYE